MRKKEFRRKVHAHSLETRSGYRKKTTNRGGGKGEKLARKIRKKDLQKDALGEEE